jgi:hypothetical protein
MKDTLIAAITILIVMSEYVVSAQKMNIEFGRATMEEIKIEHCPYDKDAEAFVLYDIGSSNFIRNENDFDVYFQRNTKIKILTDAGINFSEIEIPYYQEGNIYEQIVDLEANTYNFEHGKLDITKLDLKNCYVEKLNESWLLKKFAMPNVKKGSIIEVRYKIISPYKFNLRDWNFQWKIPVLHSEYTVKIVPFYEYSFILQGTDKFDFQSSYIDNALEEQFGYAKFKRMVYEFGMKNVQAFRDEEFITSSDDYIIKLDFQLAEVTRSDGLSRSIITTWPEMISALLKNDDFGKYIDKVEKLADKIIDFQVFDGKNEPEKVEMLVSFVKAGYSWNGIKSEFTYKSIKEFMNEKTGNSANINLFLAGLLRAAGIEAYPVILSTRDHGKIKLDYPFSHFFNYVVVMVNADNKTLLTDATEILCPYNQIPVRCINEKGLIIKKDAVNWISLDNNYPSMISKKISIAVTPETESQNCHIISNYAGYDALNFRNKFNDNAERIEEYFLEYGYKTIDSLKTSGFHNIKDPYMIEYKTTLPVDYINGKVYISPFLLEPISENPLKQAKRTYPIDMTYAKSRLYHAEVQIPHGYELEGIPERYAVNNSLVMIQYSAKEADNQLVFDAAYCFKNAVYHAADYSKLKFYFNEIIKKFNQKIVLIKVETAK